MKKTWKDKIRDQIERLENEIIENMKVKEWTEANKYYDLMLNKQIIKLERLLRDN